MDQLTLIDTTFSDVEKFESFHRHRRYTLQSLYTALDHQLQDGPVPQHEFDRMRYVVRKLFDLNLQLHAIEAEPSLPLPADVVSIPVLRGYTFEIAIHLCVLIYCSTGRPPLTSIYTRL